MSGGMLTVALSPRTAYHAVYQEAQQNQWSDCARISLTSLLTVGPALASFATTIFNLQKNQSLQTNETSKEFEAASNLETLKAGGLLVAATISILGHLYLTYHFEQENKVGKKARTICLISGGSVVVAGALAIKASYLVSGSLLAISGGLLAGRSAFKMIHKGYSKITALFSKCCWKH